MKSFLFSLAFLSLPFFADAQRQIYIDGKPIEEMYSQGFVDVCTYLIPMSNRMKVVLDFGQGKRGGIGTPSESRITDENGELIKFRSYIDVLNLFDENGFEYFGLSGGGDGFNCYLFRK